MCKCFRRRVCDSYLCILHPQCLVCSTYSGIFLNKGRQQGARNLEIIWTLKRVSETNQVLLGWGVNLCKISDIYMYFCCLHRNHLLIIWKQLTGTQTLVSLSTLLAMNGNISQGNSGQDRFALICRSPPASWGGAGLSVNLESSGNLPNKRELRCWSSLPHASLCPALAKMKSCLYLHTEHFAVPWKKNEP